MNSALKATFLFLLLVTSSLAHAQTADRQAVDPQAQTHYSDSEVQNVIDWERLVAKANEYRQRKAVAEAAQHDASSTRSH